MAILVLLGTVALTFLIASVMSRHMTADDVKSVDDALCMYYLTTNPALSVVYCN